MSATCRRASIVDALETLETPVTVDQLVDALVARSDRMGPTLEEWCDLHEELYVVDLPVLDALGTLEYDLERGLVALPAGTLEQSVSTATEPALIAQ